MKKHIYLLQPQDTSVSSYNSILNNLALKDIVLITDFNFSQLITAYKRVSLQAHTHKRTGIETQFYQQALNLNTKKKLKKPSLATPQSLLNNWDTNKPTANRRIYTTSSFKTNT